ncbi:MAG TPA: non-homologous end-joining DNA ligase [Bryobacteraceae bacterium]|nr:non-homologous end-joining DNA ligase [Bryobacteraceae bacterium]
MPRASGNKHELKVGGRTITISNPDKLMYPVARVTKAQVIDYYARVSRWLLPHLKDRPVTLKRYPEGVSGEHFYEKDAPAWTPEWVRTHPVPRRAGGPDIRYIIIDDLPTLVWCANLANLEIHPSLHRAPALDTPTLMVFDLDPGEGADILTCARVAFLLRDVLERLKLKSFAKVSGSKGIQICVPLNTPITYEVTQPFARTVAELLAREHPQLIVSDMSRAVRKRRVFIDWSQNADHKTTAGVYSLRAKRQHPFVSAPVAWDELESAVAEKDSGTLYFNPEAALVRLAKIGDLFAPVLKLKQKLPEAFIDQLAPGARKPVPKSLREYRSRRDFSATEEPAPAPPRRSRQGGRRRFVIQKHAASHLHYDFRLEMHDVLKSWAVPKGVPWKRDEKRLAQATEDHPIEYLDFEGTIPKGQYGGGTVMVWDIGTWELIEGNYYKGRLQIYLTGRKLKGEWLLVKEGGREDRRWSLIKTGASARPVSAKRDDESALTGRTMEQIANANDRQWQSNRAFPELDSLPQAPNSSSPCSQYLRRNSRRASRGAMRSNGMVTARSRCATTSA